MLKGNPALVGGPEDDHRSEGSIGIRVRVTDRAGDREKASGKKR